MDTIIEDVRNKDSLQSCKHVSQVTLKINQIPSWKTVLDHPFTTKVKEDIISLLWSM